VSVWLVASCICCCIFGCRFIRLILFGKGGIIEHFTEQALYRIISYQAFGDQQIFGGEREKKEIVWGNLGGVFRSGLRGCRKWENFDSGVRVIIQNFPLVILFNFISIVVI